VPISDSGTVTAGMMVAQKLRRNGSHHHHQRDREQQRDMHVGAEARMVSSDRNVLTLMAAGIEAWSTGSSASPGRPSR